MNYTVSMVAWTAVVVVVLQVHSLGNAVTSLRNHVALSAKDTSLQRKLLGVLWCDKYGVGPTGAFCVPNPLTDDYRDYRRRNFDSKLASALGKHFAAEGGTVADVGGSIGLYTEYLSSMGVDAKCYDGAENIEDATSGLVRHLDVTDGDALHTLGRNDWVLCLEVAEHVPLQHEDAMVDLLVTSARKGIVMSWAQPGQGGEHHVNEKSFEDVVDLFTKKKMLYDDVTTRRLRAESQLPQFRNNLMVFRTKASWHRV